MKNFLNKLRRFFIRPVFLLKEEEWTERDRENMKEFVFSEMCVTLEKVLRNRAINRREDAASKQNNEETRKAAIERKEELEDILSEFTNLRSDLEDESTR